jgi:hypothetical protein
MKNLRNISIATFVFLIISSCASSRTDLVSKAEYKPARLCAYDSNCQITAIHSHLFLADR